MNLKMSVTRLFQYAQAAAQNDQATVLTLNDMYDPMNTGAANTQPGGFDELMTIYQRFKVHSCTIDATILNNDDTSGCLVTYYASPDLTDQSGSVEHMNNQFKVKSFVLSPENSGGSRRHFRDHYVVKDYLKYKDFESLTGTASSSPTAALYWMLNIYNMEAQNVTSVGIKVTMSFYVTLADPGLFPDS